MKISCGKPCWLTFLNPQPYITQVSFVLFTTEQLEINVVSFHLQKIGIYYVRTFKVMEVLLSIIIIFPIASIQHPVVMQYTLIACLRPYMQLDSVEHHACMFQNLTIIMI